VEIELEDFQDRRDFYRDGRFSGDYDNYLLIKAIYDGDLQSDDGQQQAIEPVTMTLEEREEDEKAFQKAKWEYQHQKKPHPHRSRRYNMNCTPIIHTGSPERDWSMLRLMRDLSNVNRQTRYELGKMFWTRTRLHCEELLDLTLVNAFLLDRPAVISGIKELKLRVNAEYGWDRVDMEVYSHLAKTLQLDTLKVELYIQEELFRQLALGDVGPLLLFRCFKVAKKFEVLDACIFPTDYDQFKDWDEQDKYSEKLERELLPTIQGFLMPDSLRGEESSESLDA
jgi:hypothetical protein